MGTAEPSEPLDEDEVVSKVNGAVGETAEDPLHNHEEETIAELGDPSTLGLSIFTKLGVLGIIVAACYAFVRSHSPGRTSPAGRHGAYEKGGLP